MNYKRQIGIVFLILFVLLAVLATPWIQRFFFRGECLREFGNNIPECLFITMLSGSISFFSAITMFFLIPLYFLKENIYLAWRKFALIYLPVVAVIIALLPQYSPSGIGGSILSFDREEATFTFSFFFALISLTIIIFKAIKKRGGKSE